MLVEVVVCKLRGKARKTKFALAPYASVRNSQKSQLQTL